MGSAMGKAFPYHMCVDGKFWPGMAKFGANPKVSSYRSCRSVVVIVVDTVVIFVATALSLILVPPRITRSLAAPS